MPAQKEDTIPVGQDFGVISLNQRWNLSEVKSPRAWIDASDSTESVCLLEDLSGSGKLSCYTHFT